MWNTAGKLDNFEPALQRPVRVGEHLTVLGRNHRGNFVAMLFNQLLESKHHTRAPDRRRCSPIRERAAGRRNRCRDISFVGHRHGRRNLAGCGVKHGAMTIRGAGLGSAVDPVRDLPRRTHCRYQISQRPPGHGGWS